MQIHIKRGKESSIERGHPWIFSGAIFKIVGNPKNGDVVDVMGSNGAFLARGHYQQGTISVRVLTRNENEAIDQNFWNERLRLAVELRKKLGLFRPGNTICRLVHGEGDMLPGLIIDWFNGVAVIQCHSLGMYHSLEAIKNALIHNLGESVKAVYQKSAETLANDSGAKNGYLYGSCETPHIAEEYGHQFSIDWINGQKTGFFIDQRENRRLLAQYADGKTILNAFCYSGGFSVTALKAGAAHVDSLDSSAKAIVLTEENIKLNKLEKNHSSITADAMQHIKELDKNYDIIVLDPPAFAKHRDARHKAVQGYKRLNAHAMRYIKPGGILFTFSCSQVVDKALFNNTIIAAAMESGRQVRILEQLHQPADHPINAFHPEGEYLKGLVVEVL
jgi:23S rRNA (cytosine1962-C5)-methyltransferase